MTEEEVREEVTLKLTGRLLELELEPNTLTKIIRSSLRELQRYITETKFITIPYRKCIELNNPEHTKGEQLYVSNVYQVYRTAGFGVNDGTQTTQDGVVIQSQSITSSGAMDPLQASQWQLMSGMGNLSGFQDYSYNYMAWNALSQIRNTISTDLAFIFDRNSQKLYINVSSSMPNEITVQYIPKYQNVNEITSDYWIDVLIRMVVANTKIIAGRVRSRYTQSNAIWSQDGERILQEGLGELDQLRQTLESNTALFYNAVD